MAPEYVYSHYSNKDKKLGQYFPKELRGADGLKCGALELGRDASLANNAGTEQTVELFECLLIAFFWYCFEGFTNCGSVYELV